MEIDEWIDSRKEGYIKYINLIIIFFLRIRGIRIKFDYIL